MSDKSIFRKVEQGREKEYRPLSAYNDLTRGEIAGLKEHGISPEQFNKMDARSQNEWVHELNVDSYGSMRSANRPKQKMYFHS